MQLTLPIDTEINELIITTYETLADRIQNERIAKQPSQPFSIKQLAKMKLRFDLVIQRNIRWTDDQGTKLIESSFLGFPIPPVYALKTPDKELWLLDGKQRISKFVSFVRNEWRLTHCIVYGIDVTGMFFSELPRELQELIEDQYINVYQFDSLTTDQRDELFLRMNSGTPLSQIELVRSILGTDVLDYINELLQKPFFKLMSFTEKQIEKFSDQELALQVIGIIAEQLKDMSKSSILSYALELRTNGMSDFNVELINTVIDYLGDSFKDVDKVQKVLKKNDVIALVGAALETLEDISESEFAKLSYVYIVKNVFLYSETKRSASGTAGNIRKRIDLLVAALKENETE